MVDRTQLGLQQLCVGSPQPCFAPLVQNPVADSLAGITTKAQCRAVDAGAVSIVPSQLVAASRGAALRYPCLITGIFNASGKACAHEPLELPDERNLQLWCVVVSNANRIERSTRLVFNSQTGLTPTLISPKMSTSQSIRKVPPFPTQTKRNASVLMGRVFL